MKYCIFSQAGCFNRISDKHIHGKNVPEPLLHVSLFRRGEIQYEIIKAWNNASGETGIRGMINVHFVSQNMGIIRAEVAEAAKTVNVPSEVLNKKNIQEN